jgi:hypothetical protein
VTIDDRIEKLEFLLAGHIEQARKDYDENRRLWRDLRTDIEAIWLRMERRDEELKTRNEALDKRWRETQDMFRENKEEIRAMNRETDERIRTLVTAIGEFINKAS